MNRDPADELTGEEQAQIRKGVIQMQCKADFMRECDEELFGMYTDDQLHYAGLCVLQIAGTHDPGRGMAGVALELAASYFPGFWEQPPRPEEQGPRPGAAQ